MREFSNQAVLSMSDSTMAVSSKYTQNLSLQIVFFTFSCKWFLCFFFWAVIWSYIVDLFAALHELASASTRTLLKLASSVRALLKPYGDTLRRSLGTVHCSTPLCTPLGRVTLFRDQVLFAVCALFVCRRKVCSLIVRFYLLDVDILILGLEMRKNM